MMWRVMLAGQRVQDGELLGWCGVVDWEAAMIITSQPSFALEQQGRLWHRRWRGGWCAVRTKGVGQQARPLQCDGPGLMPNPSASEGSYS